MAVVAGGAVDPASRAEEDLADSVPMLRRAYLDSIANLRDSFTEEEIASFLDDGQINRILEELESSGEIFVAEHDDSLIIAAIATALFLSTSALSNRVVFNRSDAQVFNVLQTERLRILNRFIAQQTEVTQQVIIDGINRGLSSADSARQLRQSFGLSPGQYSAVQSYRKLLTDARQDGLPSRTALNRALRDEQFDATVERALRAKRPLTVKQIDRMVAQYAKKLLGHHADVLARTEASGAFHQGQDLMYRQAIARGEFTSEQLTRTWVTRKDDAVRGTHKTLQSQKRALDEVWTTPNGSLRFPKDPKAPFVEIVNCRCSLSIAISAIDLPAATI